MQGIEKIIEKIISDAKNDAKETAAQTKVQIKAIEKKHKQEADEQIAQITKEAEQKKVQLQQRAQTMADLEKRRNNLAIKRELVEKAFEEAAEKIKNLDKDTYVKFIKDIIIDLEPVEGEIVLGKGEKNITQTVIDDAKKSLSQKGIKSNVTLSGDKGDFVGGFILKNDRIETNCTIDMMIGNAKRNLVQEVASILFAESK